MYSFTVSEATCEGVRIAAEQFYAGDRAEAERVVEMVAGTAAVAVADLRLLQENASNGGSDSALIEASEGFNSRWARQCADTADVAAFVLGSARPVPPSIPLDIDALISVEDGFSISSSTYLVSAGTVRLVLQNNSAIGHSYGASFLDEPVELPDGFGEWILIEVELTPGEYEITCLVAGHPESVALVVD